MKEKRVLIALSVLTILFVSASVLAANDIEVDKSYACLKKQLGDNCGNTQNTVEAAFSLLSMAHDTGIQSNCESSLNSKKKTDCWGETASSSSCNLKSTAIAVLALKYADKNVDDSVKWILSKKKLSSDLTWYLEIDANNKTECTVNGQKFTVEDSKKITGANPSGLQKAYNNYWFEITDLRKNYTVSCDKNFITALLYKKTGSGVYFVSSETHSASAGDSTTESVNGYCFSTSDKCDYEGSLWATLALNNAGEDIAPLTPYLTAVADDSANVKYLPSAFLYMFDKSIDDYLSGLLNLQKQNKYWKESDDLLYDTAVALLALQDSSDEKAENARNYLFTLRETSGDRAGCWRSNTAFILYAGWPRLPGSATPGPSTSDCIAYSHYCVSRGECALDKTLENFYCSALSDVCCEVQPKQLTCKEKDGFVCEENQECTVSTVPAEDTDSCCAGSGAACQDIITESECKKNEYFCRAECLTSEVEKEVYSSSCNVEEKCCATKPTPKTNWWLIILLIILIILIILAIIFRNQLKIWLFKIKSNFKSKKGPQPTNRPSPPPSYPPSRPTIMPRQIIPRGPLARPVGRPSATRPSPPSRRAEKDKEFEETMKKLRDMGK